MIPGNSTASDSLIVALNEAASGSPFTHAVLARNGPIYLKKLLPSDRPKGGTFTGPREAYTRKSIPQFLRNIPAFHNCQIIVTWYVNGSILYIN